MKFKGHSEHNAARVLQSWPFDDPSSPREASNKSTTFLKDALPNPRKETELNTFTLPIMTRAQQTITVFALLVTVRLKPTLTTRYTCTDS